MRERLGLLPVEEEDGKKKDANAVHKALLQVTQCYSRHVVNKECIRQISIILYTCILH